MKTMLAMFVFAFILGADQAASCNCCVDDQFSAGFAQTWVQNSNYEDYNARLRFKGNAAMDYTGHRYAFNMTWHEYGEKLSGRGIYFYNEGTSYLIFNNTQCQQVSLIGRQEPYQCLPDHAHLDDTVIFGKNSLNLNSWKIRIDAEGGFHGDLRFATTQANCIPVVSSMIARTKTTHGNYAHIVQDVVFFNYTTGLGPSSFTVPDICNNASQKPTDNTVELFDNWNLLRKGMIFF